MEGERVSNREWISYGDLFRIYTNSGLSGIAGGNGTQSSYWMFATIYRASKTIAIRVWYHYGGYNVREYAGIVGYNTNGNLGICTEYFATMLSIWILS